MNTRIWMVLAVLSVGTLAACEDGAAGKPGAVGADGADGAAGADGASGEDGAAGTDGAEGAEGADANSDADGDGIHWRQDCDDNDDTVGEPSVFWMDRDGDGYGHEGVENYLCEVITGWVDNADDCDDLDDSINPDGQEICDGLDNNCDELIDDDDTTVDLSTGWEYYVDSDGDGYGDDDTTQLACSELSGLSSVPGDCDDTLGTVNPDAEEICDNGIDDNCNGSNDGCGINSDSTPDATISGTSVSFGRAIGSAGDVNGDGYDDLIAGALWESSYAGSVTLIYGAASSADMTTANGVTWAESSTYSYFGIDVEGIGDIDNDGYDDIAMGTNDEVFYIAYGGTSMSGSDPYWDTNIDVEATNSNYFGLAVHGLGDINSDGYDDFGAQEAYCGPSGWASGCVYIYTGGASLSVSMTDSDAYAVFQGAYQNYDSFGSSNSVASGDWNGDGDIDLMFGAYANDDAASSAGKAYLWWGPVSAYSGLTTDATEADATIQGQQGYDYLGYTVLSLGDINEDGYEDIATSSPYNDDGASNGGSVYVFLGSTSGISGGLSGSDADIMYTGFTDYAAMGLDLSMADLTGDGQADLLAGGQGDISYDGAVWVFEGGAASTASGVYSDEDAIAVVEGTSSGDLSGYRIATGDFNNDGADDLVTTTEETSDAYLYLGGSW